MISLSVDAEVVDVRADTPRDTDRFLLDTNVLKLMSYSRASLGSRPPQSYQVQQYPLYIQKALSSGAELCRCPLSLAELATLIEKCELDIWNGAGNPGSLKEFRHNYPSERSRVTAEIEAAWIQVKSLAATSLDAHLDDRTADAAVSRLVSQRVDGCDALMLEALANASLDQVLTDDSDWVTVPGICVFTANANSIRAAKNQGKLLAVR
jgi:hypothetical protein